MMLLKAEKDPTGFLSLFRFASAQRFGDPSGHIQGRGLWHHGTKAGPGRKFEPPDGKRPLRRRTVASTGPGSMNAENEMRALIRAGRTKEAIEFYEADKARVYMAGHNRGIQRFARWYQDAKANQP
jgi:hypothetical protein